MAIISAENVEKFCKSSVPLFDFLDIKFEFLDDGVICCHLPYDRKVSNHLNSVYAGVQWSIAEVLGGIAFAANSVPGYVPLLKSMNIEFKNPAMSDLVAIIQFTEQDAFSMKQALESQGRYNFDLKSSVQDTQGNVVAEGLAEYAIRKMS